MLKVSFKEDCMKVQTFNDRATVVTMVGQMTIPANLWQIFPEDITYWIWKHQEIDATWGAYTKNKEVFRLEFSGKSVCAEEDIFNAVTGQRIAESRAKIKLYKFMHNLCESLMKYYYAIMYGNAEFDVIRESHMEAPKDCLYLTCKKYRELWIKESHHLGKLLKEV
jgi:hypothetical protein